MTDTTTVEVARRSSGGDGRPPSEPSPWLKAAREFVGAVEKTCRTDKGARAALRRGEGKALDDPRVRSMHKIVAPLLPAFALKDDASQRAHYAIAAMIAAQRSSGAPDEQSVMPAQRKPEQQGTSPAPSPHGQSLGATFAAAVRGGTRDGMRESAAEARLNLLTRQSVQGLHRHLPATVRQLCDKKCPPDWAQLLVDIRAWPEWRGRIGRRWLQDFYRARRSAELQAARDADDQASAETPTEAV